MCLAGLLSLRAVEAPEEDTADSNRWSSFFVALNRRSPKHRFNGFQAFKKPVRFNFRVAKNLKFCSSKRFKEKFKELAKTFSQRSPDARPSGRSSEINMRTWISTGSPLDLHWIFIWHFWHGPEVCAEGETVCNKCAPIALDASRPERLILERLTLEPGKAFLLDVWTASAIDFKRSSSCPQQSALQRFYNAAQLPEQTAVRKGAFQALRTAAYALNPSARSMRFLAVQVDGSWQTEKRIGSLFATTAALGQPAS